MLITETSLTQTKYNEWFIWKLSEEERAAWLMETLAVPILQAWDQGDRVDEFVVPEELATLVSETLQNMRLPNSFTDPENPPVGYSRDKVEEDFSKFCKEAILVRNAPIEQFEIPDGNPVPESFQFIRPITVKTRENMFLSSWDESVGLTQSLRAKGVPINPSPAEKRILFLLLHVMEQLGQAEATKIKPAGESMLYQP